MKLDKIFSTRRQAIEKTKSTIFVLVAVASIVVSISVVSFKFLWDLRAYNQRVISKKEQARDVLEQNLINVEELKTKFETFEQGKVNSQLVLDALPSKYDYAALITSIDALAKRSGMILESFTGQDDSAVAVESAAQPAPIEISFSITLEGSFDALEIFTQTLDRSIRPMQIRSIEISGSDSNIKADLTISTYYQPKANIAIEKEVVQ